MSLYKIGITETGDASLDLSWAEKLDAVDGAVVVTKHISNDFCKIAVENKDKLIVHASITGFGGTVLEPDIPDMLDEIDSIRDLVKAGFPKKKIVIRVDPIIPTTKGLKTAIGVFKTYMELGFSRFRMSLIDMYPSIRDRFTKLNLPLPYGPISSYPSSDQILSTIDMINEIKDYWERINNKCTLRIETDDEPDIHNVIHCGCISSHDLSLLGLQHDTDLNNNYYQHKNYTCYAGQVELLNSKSQYVYKCLYDYYNDLTS